MILIVGGFAAGKRAFASNLGYGADDVFVLEQETDSLEILCRKKVVLYREMGCGLVPMDSALREKRDKLGRLACCLAKEATEVYRVTCGIGTQIK